jgi:parallel beta-helix repeat protein
MPTIKDCIIEANSVGIRCVNNSAPTIQNCKIKSTNGYGIYCDYNSAPTIQGCIIEANSYGIYCYHNSAPTIKDCIIEANSDGIRCGNNSAPTIQNCKIKSTNEHGIFCYDNSDPIISHCRIEAGGTDKSGIYLVDTDSNPKVYHSTIIATGTGNSIYGPSGTNIYCALCTMNKEIGSDCVNQISNPNNVVDSDM